MTPGTRSVLAAMAAAYAAEDYENAELVVEGWVCYLGTRRVHRKTVNALIDMLALKDESDTGADGHLKRYVISDTGQALLRRPELEEELFLALHRKRAFCVRNDRIEDLD